MTIGNIKTNAAHAAVAPTRTILILLVVMNGVGRITLLARSGPPVSRKTVRHHGLSGPAQRRALHDRTCDLADRDRAAIGPVWPAPRSARRHDADRRRDDHVHFRAHASPACHSSLLSGPWSGQRHGDVPRDHPRHLPPQAARRHDQPCHRCDDDRADDQPADRRTARYQFRMACHFLLHGRGIVACHHWRRLRSARDKTPPGFFGRRRIRQRRARTVIEPRFRQLRTLPDAGIRDHLHLRGWRPLHRRGPDGTLHRRIWPVVCDRPASLT